jgi:hypothetical protein
MMIKKGSRVPAKRPAKRQRGLRQGVKGSRVQVKGLTKNHKGTGSIKMMNDDKEGFEGLRDRE